MIILHRCSLFAALALTATGAWAQMPTGGLPATPAAAATPLPDVTMPTITNADARPAVMPAALPTTPVPAAAESTTVTAMPETATGSPVANDDNFSFGSAPGSLLFTTEQIEGMKRSLRAFETIRPNSAANTDIQMTEALPAEAPPVVEPAAYPVFVLSSIAYHTPGDWTVWINNARITPKKNNGEVRVVSVQPDRVWLRWSPSYAQAVVERYRKKLYAPVDPMRHRMTLPNTASMGSDGSVMFSLKPNQSFVSGYFSTFEGKVAAPVLPPLAPPATANANGSLSNEQASQIKGLLDQPAPAGPVNSEQKEMDQIIKNQQGMFQHIRQPATMLQPPASSP